MVRSTASSPAAAHRTIVVVDVERFSDRRRTNPDQLAVRAGLYGVLKRAFRRAGIRWSRCRREDRGDGVFILVPAELSKKLFVEQLPNELVDALLEHNATHTAAEQIRLRMALHAGEVNYDTHGVTGTSVIHTFRLNEAAPLKAALASSPGVLAVIVSPYFYDEVVSHSTTVDPATYRQVNVAVKETRAVGWISLPDHPYPPRIETRPSAGLTSPQPQQLPAHTPYFVGRDHELRQLTAQLNSGGNVVVVSTINGTAGIGKTALAMHWAHQVADRFPDGQLYVNLRGFHETGVPLQPSEAIRGFLDAFAIPAERIPSRLDAQAALFRSVLADRRVLIVLDNAHDADQVRPLLPGSSTCVVVITSRNQLTDLVTREGARPVNLDVLTQREADALLTRRIGLQRTTAEPDAVRDLVEYCRGLPLALAIVAARTELNPSLKLRVLADQLADERTRLSVLDEVRAVFTWSYQHLDPAVARMFRLLGIHPGAAFSLAAAASLAGVPVERARKTLTALTDARLLVEVSRDRFVFHDLVRAYAADRAMAFESDEDRRAATHRLLDHYLHSAFLADSYHSLHRDVHPDGPPRSGVTLDLVENYHQAMMWFTTEHRTLLSAVELAYRDEFDTHAWKLLVAMGPLLEKYGLLTEVLAIEDKLIAAAKRLDDKMALGHVYGVVGWTHARLGDYVTADAFYDLSMGLCAQLNHQFGTAMINFMRTATYYLRGLYPEAINQAKRSVEYAEAADYRVMKAIVHQMFAVIYSRAGDQEQAVDQCRQALALFEEIGDQRYQATTLATLARAQHALGDNDQAIANYIHSAKLNRQLGDHYNEAKVLQRLGDIQQSIGDDCAARATWQQALTILDRLHLPDADQIRVQLGERFQSR